MKNIMITSLFILIFNSAMADCGQPPIPSCGDILEYKIIKTETYENSDKLLKTNAVCTVTLEEVKTNTISTINLEFCPKNKNKFFAAIQRYHSSCGDTVRIKEKDAYVEKAQMLENNKIEVWPNKICDKNASKYFVTLFNEKARSSLVGKNLGIFKKNGFTKIADKDDVFVFHAHPALSVRIEVDRSACKSSKCDEGNFKIRNIKPQFLFAMFDDKGKLYYPDIKF